MYANLKALRESLAMTQRDFAASLNMAPNTYNNYENGMREPRSDFWIAVAQKYGVTIDYLMGFSNDPHQTADTKQAPSDLSEEAINLAYHYDMLSPHGKGAIEAILNYEETSPISVSSPSERPTQPFTALPMVKRRSDGFSEIKVYEQPAAAGLGNYLDEPPYHMEQYPAGIVPEMADFGVVISGDSMEPEIHDGGTVFVQSAPSINAGEVGIFVLDGRAYCKKIAVDYNQRQVQLLSLNPAYEPIPVSGGADFYTLGRVLGQWTPGIDHYQP